MVKRYHSTDIEILYKTIPVFECPDCAFEFSAEHETDDELGGWECPLCELHEKIKEE